MSKTDLLVKLRELHEELASINDHLDSGEQIGDETIDALGDVMSDVSQIVDKTSSEDRDDAGQENKHHDLADRITQLETNHPRITRFLSQITDLLAMMGI